MKVKVNNKEVDTKAVYLSQLIDELQLPVAGVAVGVDNKMVSRNTWGEFALSDGQNIIIIKAACGG